MKLNLFRQGIRGISYSKFSTGKIENSSGIKKNTRSLSAIHSKYYNEEYRSLNGEANETTAKLQGVFKRIQIEKLNKESLYEQLLDTLKLTKLNTERNLEKKKKEDWHGNKKEKKKTFVRRTGYIEKKQKDMEEKLKRKGLKISIVKLFPDNPKSNRASFRINEITEDFTTESLQTTEKKDSKENNYKKVQKINLYKLVIRGNIVRRSFDSSFLEYNPQTEALFKIHKGEISSYKEYRKCLIQESKKKIIKNRCRSLENIWKETEIDEKNLDNFDSKYFKGTSRCLVNMRLTEGSSEKKQSIVKKVNKNSNLHTKSISKEINKTSERKQEIIDLNVGEKATNTENFNVNPAFAVKKKKIESKYLALYKITTKELLKNDQKKSERNLEKSAKRLKGEKNNSEVPFASSVSIENFNSEKLLISNPYENESPIKEPLPENSKKLISLIPIQSFSDIPDDLKQATIQETNISIKNTETEENLFYKEENLSEIIETPLENKETPSQKKENSLKTEEKSVLIQCKSSEMEKTPFSHQRKYRKSLIRSKTFQNTIRFKKPKSKFDATCRFIGNLSKIFLKTLVTSRLSLSSSESFPRIDSKCHILKRISSKITDFLPDSPKSSSKSNTSSESLNKIIEEPIENDIPGILQAIFPSHPPENLKIPLPIRKNSFQFKQNLIDHYLIENNAIDEEMRSRLLQKRRFLQASEKLDKSKKSYKLIIRSPYSEEIPQTRLAKQNSVKFDMKTYENLLKNSLKKHSRSHTVKVSASYKH